MTEINNMKDELGRLCGESSHKEMLLAAYDAYLSGKRSDDVIQHIKMISDTYFFDDEIVAGKDPKDDFQKMAVITFLEGSADKKIIGYLNDAFSDPKVNARNKEFLSSLLAVQNEFSLKKEKAKKIAALIFLFIMNDDTDMLGLMIDIGAAEKNILPWSSFGIYEGLSAFNFKDISSVRDAYSRYSAEVKKHKDLQRINIDPFDKTYTYQWMCLSVEVEDDSFLIDEYIRICFNDNEFEVNHRNLFSEDVFVRISPLLIRSMIDETLSNEIQDDSVVMAELLSAYYVSDKVCDSNKVELYCEDNIDQIISLYETAMYESLLGEHLCCSEFSPPDVGGPSSTFMKTINSALYSSIKESANTIAYGFTGESLYSEETLSSLSKILSRNEGDLGPLLSKFVKACGKSSNLSNSVANATSLLSGIDISSIKDKEIQAIFQRARITRDFEL